MTTVLRRVLPALFTVVTALGCQKAEPVTLAAAEPAAAPVPAPKAIAAAAPADSTFPQKITPFLATYCNGCHNAKKQAGGVALDAYLSEAHARKDRKTWEAVQHVLAAGEMPPKNKPQPPKGDREFVLGWIEATLTKVDCTARPDPGRVTLHRLNKAEYDNTIRDLCGVTPHAADDFPTDDVGYGFDNIGDVLSLQPILLEKYLTAADKVLDAALPPLDTVASTNQKFTPQSIQTTPREARSRGDRVTITFTTGGSAFLPRFHFPAAGEYVIRLRGWGTAVDGAAPKVALKAGDKEATVVTVDAKKEKPGTYEGKLTLPPGDREVTAVFTNPSSKGSKEPRTFGVTGIEVEGPIGGAAPPVPSSVKLILVAKPTGKADSADAAKKVLMAFARRAFRRPVKPAELDRLMKLFALAESQGDSWEKALRLPLKAVLCSPHFLFRVEDDPKPPETVRQLTDFELASRLSYFLWSSMPDDQLYSAAERGDLRKPGGLKPQIERMLKDPKATALTENFAGQWLQLRTLKTLSPDPGTYKNWDEPLRAAMVRESELFFDHVVKTDRSVLDLLDANYTFANDRLARHYGLPGVTGPEFRKVTLGDTRRGGVVTQASVLTVTSNPTRTSPVKRGKWILENVLGTPPPPPAPDVPELPPAGQLKGTLRQQMEQHRSNPACAGCHAKLDPMGFGLENFDGIGGWRDADNKQKIDATGVLPDGAKFDGPAQLRKVLVGKADQFRHCFAEKLMTYALGRGLEYYDKCALDAVAGKLKGGGDRFSTLVLAICETDAFQKRTGKRSE